MVHRGINDAIFDGLGDDVLGILLAIQSKLDANIAEGDAGIRQGDGTQSSLDDEMPQTKDEEAGTIALECLLVFLESGLEGGDIAYSDGLDDLEVWGERGFEARLAEGCSIRNDTGEEDDDNVEFVNLESGSRVESRRCTHRLHKPRCHFILWSSPDGPNKVIGGFGIVQLDGPQPSTIIKIPDVLSLICVSLKIGLGNELVGLVVLIVVEVRAEE